MKHSIFFSVLLVLVLLVSTSLAAIPTLINYQGMLTNDAGDPLNGDYDLSFSIYSQSSGGSALWSEGHTAVSVDKGLFNVTLGSTTPIPSSLFDDTTRYLGITIEADPELSPRVRLTSVGYAYQALKADTANYALAAPESGGDLWMFRITDTADTTIITSGRWGIARYGNVLFGNVDSTHVNLGVACTTGTSGDNYGYCTVGGGYQNSASSNATVGGGTRNSASGGTSTVGGGFVNSASGGEATIGGGSGNTASGYRSSVGGGHGNTASGGTATVGGGENNDADSGYATIGGGFENTAYTRATVGGGESNIASGEKATVAGGWVNTASNYYATVGGGGINTASGEKATVGGGWMNAATGSYATVGGGEGDTASSTYATVGGGYGNIASDFRTTIAGGYDNTAGDFDATVGGGYGNTASMYRATIGGGWGNSASGGSSTIGGGEHNSASNTYATIAGGYYNSVSGNGATIPGGYGDTVEGDYSFAVGKQVRLTSSADYTFAFGYNFTTSSNNAAVFYLPPPGIRVGINKTDPSYAIDLPNNADASGQGRANQWTTYSSIRWKENVNLIDHALDKVLALRGVYFDWKQSKKRNIGMIAEDVGRVVPEVVNYERNGIDAEGMDYARLTALLVEAIKEQQREIGLLKARIESLETQGR